MDRSLLVERPDRNPSAGVSAADLLQIAKQYSVDPPKGLVKKAEFSGRFDAAMPQDVGGAGGHYTYASSLGTAHVYLERIRGQDDLLLQWERQTTAIDLLVDLVVNWADATFAAEPKRWDLHVFLAGPFRRDVKNVMLYSRWSGRLPPLDERPAGDEPVSDQAIRSVVEFAGPASQYLLERGYFVPQDLPQLSRAYAKDDAKSSEGAMEMLRRIVRRHLGHDAKPESLGALATPEALGASFVSHCAGNKAAAELVKQWSESQPVRTRVLTDPSDVLTAALTDALGLPVMDDFDDVKVTLEPGVRPYAMNGRWNEADRTVTWTGSVETSIERAAGLPFVAVALWSTPDEVEQRRLFGDVILRDYWLARYCVSRQALTEAEETQWRQFLESLAESKDRFERVSKFRFAGAEKADDPPDVAEQVRDALRTAAAKDKAVTK